MLVLRTAECHITCLNQHHDSAAHYHGQWQKEELFFSFFSPPPPSKTQQTTHIALLYNAIIHSRRCPDQPS